MEQQTLQALHRTDPLILGAAASVLMVSLLGIAAFTGLLPMSHGSEQPSPTSSTAAVTNVVMPEGPVRDLSPELRPASPPASYRPAHRKVVHHYTQPSFQGQQGQYAQNSDEQGQYAQNSYAEPERPPAQPAVMPQQHPVQNYVNDMNPVGAGLGAVVGGLLGHQIGGGRGKTLATVAGALLGGYAGNEVAHDRSPIP